MRFIEGKTSDGLRVLGVLSEAVGDEPWLVLHIHGYGGDFYSNSFVRALHELLPRRGISFASIGLRTLGYVNEIYINGDVRYIGSALADHDACHLDIDAAIEALGFPPRRLVLQGHSFGTNVVRDYLVSGRHPIRRAVFLSPADSIALNEEWLRRHPASSLVKTVATAPDVLQLEWQLFGIAVGAMDYPVPIAAPALERLVGGRVFPQWSANLAAVQTPALVVKGAEDPISNFGTMADEGVIRTLLPNATVRVIPEASHGFIGHEAELALSITNWVLSGDPDQAAVNA